MMLAEGEQFSKSADTFIAQRFGDTEANEVNSAVRFRETLGGGAAFNGGVCAVAEGGGGIPAVVEGRDGV